MEASRASGNGGFRLAKTVAVPSKEGQAQQFKAATLEVEDPDATCYVAQFAVSPTLPPQPGAQVQISEILASADSSYSICLFSRQSLDLIGKVEGHGGPISHLQFSRDSPMILWSSSADRSIRCWDLRSQQTAAALAAPNEVSGFDIAGHVIAAGVKEKVAFWDMRKVETTKTPALVFDNSHNEEITTVKFHPGVSNKLFTGAVDGLICVFDVAQPTEDDALITVLPIDEAISTFGFMGPTGGDIWSLSSDQTISLWNIDQCEELAKHKNVQNLLAEKIKMDYCVDCHYDTAANQLYLFTGTNDGAIGLVLVDANELKPGYLLEGGHNAVVRCVDWNSQNKTLITGGEDTRISMWTV